MNKKTEYLTKRIQEADDEAFIELADTIAKRSADTPVESLDGVIHVKELADTLERVRADKGKLKGHSTGYRELDKRMGGLERGSVILISGSTSVGKSALATNIALNVAAHSPVLFVSLEMSREQMLERMDNVVGDEVLRRNLVLQKSFAINYRDLEPLLRRAKEEHKVELVVLDYLQYLGRGMTLDEFAKMSKTIKSLALRYDICFMVITSLRKGSADTKFKRKWHEVEAEDILGTSAVAYDADTIVTVSRKDLENEYQPGGIFVKVLKTRNSELKYDDAVASLAWEGTKITETGWTTA